jgi:hypothetical protein
MSVSKRKKLEALLDGRQKVAALAVMEREFAAQDERRSLEDIAGDAGVTVRTLYEWRTQNKTFIDYVNLLSDDFLASKRPAVYKRLMQLIDASQPSVKAIDLFMRREGLITTQVAVETKDASAAKSNEEIAEEIEEFDALLAETEGGRSLSHGSTTSGSDAMNGPNELR